LWHQHAHTWRLRAWQHLQLQQQRAAQQTAQLVSNAELALASLYAAVLCRAHHDMIGMSWIPEGAAWQLLLVLEAQLGMLGWVLLEEAAGRFEPVLHQKPCS
jgi:hypothetical protein